MSFSFSLRAATRSSILEHLSAQLDALVAAQPIHASDREVVEATTEAVLGLVPEADGRDYSVTVSGSIGTTDDVVTFASVSVMVGYAAADTSSLESGGGGHGDPDGPK